jgi:hypothetical protein
VRFARLDAELPQHAQRLLFGAGPGVDPLAAYSDGWRLTPAPGRAPWECEALALATLDAGALYPLPEERSRGGRVSLVEAWRRFDALRQRDDERDGERDEPPQNGVDAPQAPAATPVRELFNEPAPSAPAPRAARPSRSA